MPSFNRKLSFAVFLIILLFCILYAFRLSEASFVHNRDVQNLTFSNTQTWAQEYLDDIKAPSIFTPEQLASITLPPFPANDSAETRSELLQLHAKELLRTPSKLQEINNENISAQLSVYGTTTLQTFINPQIRPYTSHLIDFIYAKTGGVILSQKMKFNRVRASYLDPTLTTALPVPQHASYPSGHSTQAHMIATILSMLDPKHTTMYFDSAERIAMDREVAGLHYPSDTEAGRLLAGQLIYLLFQNPEFVNMYTQAKTEWH